MQTQFLWGFCMSYLEWEKKMPKTELQQIMEEKYKGQLITVSNSMIRARETTTLLESKIEALAIYYSSKDAKQRTKKDANGKDYDVNYVVIPMKEVSYLMSREDGSGKRAGGKTYSEVKTAAISMKQKVFVVEDRENNQFIAKSMYGDIAYDNGKLYIEFEPSMEKYFLNLKQNFSKLKLPILFSYKRNGGFQLYKLLKSYAYPPNLEHIDMSLAQEDLPTFSLTWDITALRSEMGYVDLNQPLIKEEITLKRKPDWEKIEKIEKKKKKENEEKNKRNKNNINNNEDKYDNNNKGRKYLKFVLDNETVRKNQTIIQNINNIFDDDNLLDLNDIDFTQTNTNKGNYMGENSFNNQRLYSNRKEKKFR